MRMHPAATVLAALAVALVPACSAPPAAPAPPAPAPAPSAPDTGLPERLVADVTGPGAYAHLAELQRIADAKGGNRALGRWRGSHSRRRNWRRADPRADPLSRRPP